MAISVLRLEKQRDKFMSGASATHSQKAKPFVALERDGAAIKRLSEQLIAYIKSDNTLGAINALLNGANVNARDFASRTALMLAVIKGQTELAKFLVECGASVNAADDYGQTPLMWAAMGGNVHLVEFLIKKGANVNAVDIHGNNALMMAIHGNKETIKILLKAGAETKQTDACGKSAFDQALSMHRTDIAAFLAESVST